MVRIFPNSLYKLEGTKLIVCNSALLSPIGERNFPPFQHKRKKRSTPGDIDTAQFLNHLISW